MERSTAVTKKSPDGLTVARAYHPAGSLLSEVRMNYINN